MGLHGGGVGNVVAVLLCSCRAPQPRITVCSHKRWLERLPTIPSHVERWPGFPLKRTTTVPSHAGAGSSRPSGASDEPPSIGIGSDDLDDVEMRKCGGPTGHTPSTR